MPTWKELKRFCERDGWELYKETDHYFYRKFDENGNIRLSLTLKILPPLWRRQEEHSLKTQGGFRQSRIFR
jgi:hypothetical protein